MPRIGSTGSLTATTSSTVSTSKPVDSDLQSGGGGHAYGAPSWGEVKNEGIFGGQHRGSSAANTHLGAGLSPVKDKMKVKTAKLVDFATHIPDVVINPNP